MIKTGLSDGNFPSHGLEWCVNLCQSYERVLTTRFLMLRLFLHFIQGCVIHEGWAEAEMITSDEENVYLIPCLRRVEPGF